MKSRGVIVGALLGIVLLLGWNLLLFSPKGRDLRTQLNHLVDISHNGPEIAAELDKLSAAVPAAPDLDGFILSANQIAVQSGIDWLSVSPGVVQAGTTGPSVVPLSIQVKGGFFQVLDYLNRLEDMGRLVIIDGINLTAAADVGAGASATPTGPPTLSVTLTARMFTRADPVVAGGTSPTPGPTGGTSSPPASGNSSGETSTTAQVN